MNTLLRASGYLFTNTMDFDFPFLVLFFIGLGIKVMLASQKKLGSVLFVVSKGACKRLECVCFMRDGQDSP